jgi:hypothetical protein
MLILGNILGECNICLYNVIVISDLVIFRYFFKLPVLHFEVRLQAEELRLTL